MKVRNKFIASALAACLMVGTVTPVWAGTIQNSPAVTTDATTEEETNFVAPATLPYFASVTGIVTAINEVDGNIVLTVTSDKLGDTILIINENTYVDNIGALEVGSEVHAFYNGRLPMTMQFPARHQLEALVVNPENFTMADMFDENLLADSGTLKLNLPEDLSNITIVTPNNEAYTGELGGQKLLVYYAATTRSIPAQTSPSKIVVFAENLGETTTDETTDVELNDEAALGQEDVAAPTSAYNSFTGTIIAINDHTEENTLIVTVEHAEGGLANIIVKPETALIDMDKLEVGQAISAFFYSNTPMIMIYPAQYVAQVVVNAESNILNVVVDIFDENLVSFDGTLQINIGEDTVILNIDGSPFEGSIEDLIARHLVVFYTIATFSLPAQTTPSVIYVIPMEGMQAYDNENTTVPATPYVVGTDVIISGEKVNAPVHNNETGVSTIALRPVAQALGLNVNWNGELRVITIGDNIVIDIDAQTVTKDGEIVTLEIAPSIVNGVTYVSLEFITAVLGIPTAR